MRRNAPTGHPWIVVDGRPVAPSVYRPTTVVDLESSPEWWGALALLGALVAGAGAVISSGSGEAVALGGVALFFATAVCAGAGRTEVATALGFAGMVWTAAGISAVLGTDPSPTGTVLGFGAVGLILAALGLLGGLRAHRRSTAPVRAPPSD